MVILRVLRHVLYLAASGIFGLGMAAFMIGRTFTCYDGLGVVSVISDLGRWTFFLAIAIPAFFLYSGRELLRGQE